MAQIFVDELGSRCGIDAVINKDATGEISDHDRPLPAELHHHRVYGTYEPWTVVRARTCTFTMHADVARFDLAVAVFSVL